MFWSNSSGASEACTRSSGCASKEITKPRSSARVTFFHLENWYSLHAVIERVLKLTGLYSRARRNAERVLLKRNDIRCEDLPPRFDGFTILHISDMHVDMNEAAMRRVIELVGGLRYELCVLNGDYRAE